VWHTQFVSERGIDTLADARGIPRDPRPHLLVACRDFINEAKHSAIHPFEDVYSLGLGMRPHLSVSKEWHLVSVIPDFLPMCESSHQPSLLPSKVTIRARPINSDQKLKATLKLPQTSDGGEAG
jgi:hypothetical protein